MFYLLSVLCVQCHEQKSISAKQVQTAISSLLHTVALGKKFKKSIICEKVKEYFAANISAQFILKELYEYDDNESYVKFIKENYVEILSYQFNKDYKDIYEYFRKITQVNIEECEKLYENVYICRGQVLFASDNAKIKVIMRNEDNIFKIESFILHISGLKISLASKLIPYFHLLSKENFLPSKWEKKVRKLIKK